jgi:hypothetical protein
MTAKEQLEQIKNYHSTAFIFLNETNPLFYPKKIFMLNNEEHISLFEKELISGRFYTEIVDDFNNPVSQERLLYRFKGNEFSKSEYICKENLVNGSLAKKYYVPLSDFEKINVIELKKQETKKSVKKLNIKSLDESPTTVSIIDFEKEKDQEKEDLIISKMTIRDYAAITWKKPVSTREWLNKLIENL